jgi:hypothetical protein
MKRNIATSIKLLASFVLMVNTVFAYAQTKDCNCQQYESRNSSFQADISFSKSENNFETELIEKWEDQEKCDKIKSIYFLDFDTIPKEFSRFRNVEKLKIVTQLFSRNIYGLHYFPNLRELTLWGSKLIINDSAIWTTNIEKLTTNKVQIIGLNSFLQFKNLKELNMGYSGFDRFPNDFNSLDQLNVVSFYGHTLGFIDLGQVDFAKLKSLEYFSLVCWFDRVSGIPKGLRNCLRI